MSTEYLLDMKLKGYDAQRKSGRYDQKEDRSKGGKKGKEKGRGKGKERDKQGQTPI